MAVVKWPRLQQYDAEMKQYIATHYESKLRFGPTPVYSVTLAEETEMTVEQPYAIDLSAAQAQEIYVIIVSPPGGEERACHYDVVFSDESMCSYQTRGVDLNNTRVTNVHFYVYNGVAFFEGNAGVLGAFFASKAGGLFTSMHVLPHNAYISTLNMWLYSGDTKAFPAGTQITIYVTTEV